MKEGVSVPFRKIQLAKGQYLGQSWALTRRSGRHMAFVDKAPPFFTQYSICGVKVKVKYHPERAVRLHLFVLTHREDSLYQWGHREARQELLGGQFGDKHFVFTGAFGNNRW